MTMQENYYRVYLPWQIESESDYHSDIITLSCDLTICDTYTICQSPFASPDPYIEGMATTLTVNNTCKRYKVVLDPLNFLDS